MGAAELSSGTGVMSRVRKPPPQPSPTPQAARERESKYDTGDSQSGEPPDYSPFPPGRVGVGNSKKFV